MKLPTGEGEGGHGMKAWEGVSKTRPETLTSPGVMEPGDASLPPK